MLLVTFAKGWFLGLDKALKGAGIAGKVHELTLKNGEMLHDMNGGMAPKLWADGEHDAVLTYLRGDVEQTLALAQNIHLISDVRCKIYDLYLRFTIADLRFPLSAEALAKADRLPKL